jgi:hypothetical protein
MEQKIIFKYLNAKLKIGMIDLMTVYLLSPELKKFLPEVYKGKLVYRIKGSSKRVSYQTVKKELVCKSFYLTEEIPF